MRTIGMSLLALLLLAPVADMAGADEPGAEEGMQAPAPRRRGEPAPAAPAPGTAAEAAAAEPDCFWLPDIRCGRSGRWDGFEKPIVQPFLFEDPFVTTGVYPYYVWHEFSEESALLGGEVHVAAVQARLALTDRLGFVASKDGYVWFRPDNPLLDDQQGFWDFAAGLKYAFLVLPEQQLIASALLRVEIFTGSSDVLAGGGDGVAFLPSVSAAWAPVERLHLIGDVGVWVPTDGDDHSSYLFWHAYVDYSVHEHFQPFVQLSGERYLTSGDGRQPVRLKGGAELPIDAVQHALGTGHFEGIDVINLGSRGMDNDQYVDVAIGFHVPINEHVTWSAAYQRPISGREMITDQRVVTSLQFEY